LFTMVNKLRKETLLTVVAEWLEEGGISPLVSRSRHAIDLENLGRILAVVGAKRAGKTYFMDQLIQSLLESTHCRKEDIFS